MEPGTIERLQAAIAANDTAAVETTIRALPAELIPEARKLVGALPDSAQAEAAVRAVDERAAELGVALSA